MEKQENKARKVLIPLCEFGGNCSDCIYYEPYNTTSSGRAYCSYRDSYYFASERNGCFHYKRRER